MRISVISGRRGGRVVEGSGLENRGAETYRGFESHPLRVSGETYKYENWSERRANSEEKANAGGPG